MSRLDPQFIVTPKRYIFPEIIDSSAQIYGMQTSIDAQVVERQTRHVQVVVPSRACGFKSRPEYHLSPLEIAGFFVSIILALLDITLTNSG